MYFVNKKILSKVKESFTTFNTCRYASTSFSTQNTMAVTSTSGKIISNHIKVE